MKKIYILVSLIMFALIVSSCSTQSLLESENTSSTLSGNVESDEVNSKSDDLVKLRFAMMPSDSSAPIVVAEKLGYFKEVGIDIDLNLFFSAKDRDSALQSGNIDGADYDLITAITAISNGSKFKVLYGSSGYFKLVANEVDFNKISGKSVGISENTIIEYYVDKIIESNNIDKSMIKKEIIPQIPVRLQMLEAKKIDMALLPDPLATLATINGAKVLANSSDYGENIGAFIFTDDFLTSNPETYEKFASAYDKGAKFILENDNDKYIDYLISDLGFPEPVRETLSLVKFDELKRPSQETFDEVLKWLKEKKLIEKEILYKDIIK